MIAEAYKKFPEEYHAWVSMRQRCANPNNPDFHHYGGRGITFCDRWNNFENFINDMGPKPEGLSLGRIDNDKGYGPENCRWETMLEQANNRRPRKLGAKNQPQLA